jgi:Peptidyl-prolyl cis-trans isomerase (rotamase) - cyclophilin family
MLLCRCFLDIGIENERYLGRMVIELYDDIVPQTAENFLALCEGTYEHTYKGCPFHKIIAGIYCQGGDITKFNGFGGISIYGEVFPDENFLLQHSGPGIERTN